jgi:hypothetical protein
MKATELVSRLLTNATDLSLVQELVAEDATYVSLNYYNPDLTAVRFTQPSANRSNLSIDRTMVRHAHQSRTSRSPQDIRRRQQILGSAGLRHLHHFLRAKHIVDSINWP